MSVRLAAGRERQPTVSLQQMTEDIIIIRSEPHSGAWPSELDHSRQSDPALDARWRKGRCWLVSGQPQQCGSTCVLVSLFASSSPTVGHERQRTEHGGDPTLASPGNMPKP